MGRGITTWAFALVAVRRGERLLVVHEAKHGQRWWLPAGAVEPGESFAEAALRETREEAGLDVRLEGVVRVERSVVEGGARERVLFVASPVDDTPPKSVADEHSLEARWCTQAELDALPLRGEEPRELLEYLTRGGVVFPLSVLAAEGDPL